MNVALLVDETEHEWGQRPDGFYLCKNREEYAKLVKNFDPGPGKGQYWTLGSPRAVEVVDETSWSKLQELGTCGFNEFDRQKTYNEI